MPLFDRPPCWAGAGSGWLAGRGVAPCLEKGHWQPCRALRSWPSNLFQDQFNQQQLRQQLRLRRRTSRCGVGVGAGLPFPATVVSRFGRVPHLIQLVQQYLPAGRGHLG